MNVRLFFTKHFGQEKKENESATFFCLPKLLDRNPGQKRGCLFCLMSHLVAPKILDKKKGVVLFGLPKILHQKRMKVRRFLFTKNPGQKQRGELFLLNVPPSCPKNPGQEKMNVRHFVLPKRLDKKKWRCNIFLLTKNPGQTKGVNFFWPHVPPSRPKNPKQILDKEKMNVRHIFA